jgi:hypothetical protein
MSRFLLFAFFSSLVAAVASLLAFWPQLTLSVPSTLSSLSSQV